MEEVRVLPLPLADVLWVERCGLVVDLETGERFFPVDKWSDFGDRWVREIVRRGERPTVERFASAIQRACEYQYGDELCRAMAEGILQRAMDKVCTVQVA
jgi:hypothetical protein